MLKQLTAWVVLITLLVSTLLLHHQRAKASDLSAWIDSAVSIQKQADANAVPSSLNGNIDCYEVDEFNCAVSTVYGTATQNSNIELNGSSSYLPVSNYIENRIRFIPVPNSDMAISYTTEPAYGVYLYFNYNLSSSITLQTDFSGPHYQITQPPDGMLADKANHRLAADYGSMSFSENGQWMVVSDPNEAMLRVNLSTFEVSPFAPGFNYTVGIDPSIKTAISNDGRFAVVASQGFSTWKIYDLSTCGTVPDTILGPVNCQERDLKVEFNQKASGYKFADHIRFIDDDTLAGYVNYKINGNNLTSRFMVSDKPIANQLEYLALGDSYISGEGAFDYQPGTDDSDNHCHLSGLAYPYLIGHDLNYDSYRSVACSGAVTGDITDKSIPNSKVNKVQATGKDKADFDSQIYDGFLPGYRAQINFVNLYQPKVITLSVGGNDMGFSNILRTCVDPKNIDTCYSTYEDRLELVNQINNTVYPRLAQTYQELKAASPPDTHIYVVGYPQIAKPGGGCALNVHFNNDELELAQQLIAYLDSVIKVAAEKTGIYYVDTQDALNGHRLCEAGPGSVAVNGLTAGNDAPIRGTGPIGAESYHPNPTGYELLENKILSVTKNLTLPMPAANPSASLPPTTTLGILDLANSGRSVKVIEQDDGISNDLAYQKVPIDISINGAAHSLVPGSTIHAEVHSDPVGLGDYNVNQNGELAAQVTIPSSVPAGYHSLHFYGTDINGQAIDIYKYIYLAATADDLDGNGVMDSSQGCVDVASSGQDYDQDGIDDSCDPNILQSPSTGLGAQFTDPRQTMEPTIEANVTNTNQTAKSNPMSRFGNNPTQPPNQTKVLSASIARSKPQTNSHTANNIRVPVNDFILAGMALLAISTLAWVLF